MPRTPEERAAHIAQHRMKIAHVRSQHPELSDVDAALAYILSYCINLEEQLEELEEKVREQENNQRCGREQVREHGEGSEEVPGLEAAN